MKKHDDHKTPRPAHMPRHTFQPLAEEPGDPLSKPDLDAARAEIRAGFREALAPLEKAVSDAPKAVSWESVEAAWKTKNPDSTEQFADLAPGYRAQLWKEANKGA